MQPAHHSSDLEEEAVRDAEDEVEPTMRFTKTMVSATGSRGDRADSQTRIDI